MSAIRSIHILSQSLGDVSHRDDPVSAVTGQFIDYNHVQSSTRSLPLFLRDSRTTADY